MISSTHGSRKRYLFSNTLMRVRYAQGTGISLVFCTEKKIIENQPCLTTTSEFKNLRISRIRQRMESYSHISDSLVLFMLPIWAARFSDNI